LGIVYHFPNVSGNIQKFVFIHNQKKSRNKFISQNEKTFPRSSDVNFLKYYQNELIIWLKPHKSTAILRNFQNLLGIEQV